MGTDPQDARDVALTEATRQRLVALAADVVGALPAVDVPAALRPIARFTPTRRARLGAPVIAAVLDADAVFRDRVAAVAAAALPELADAVRDGGTTASSNPTDVAAMVYLLRPSGWVDALAGIDARRGTAAAGEELARLRGDIDDLRARARVEAAATRAAVSAATEELAAELTQARRTIRIRTGELRTAERARDHALAATVEIEARFGAADAAREVEARRARARIADLEAALEVVRRAGRTERDLDDARLWLLVDSVTQAAAGIRRELSLSAPSLHPGDVVRSAGRSESDRRVVDIAALERVLALPHAHLVVDGYNVTKTGYPQLPLVEQRSRLVSGAATLVARIGAEVTVAFDGGDRPPVQPAVPRGVRVLFSAPQEIADDLIRRLVAAEPEGRTVIVVSSDQQVATDVRRAGSWSAPSAVLLALLG